MVGEQQSAWSISLGSWYGVAVRMHMLFFVFAVMTFYFGWYATGDHPGSEYYSTAIAAFGILFVSIFIHEMAHGVTANCCGGRMEAIEVFPWGGSSSIELPSNKRQQFLVHISGPLSNLLVCLGCAVFLVFDPSFSIAGSWAQLFHPLKPVILNNNLFASSVALVFWINWLVFLINLLPVSPFDGGKIVRSAIPLIWPDTRTDQVYLGSMIVSMMTSVGFCVMAWVVRDNEVVTLVPMWLVLILLAIVVFFGARRQTQLDLRDLEDLLDHNAAVYGEKIMDTIENRAFDEFDDETDDREISDWLYQHKFEQESATRQDPGADEEEENNLDEILAKINDVGIDGLTEYERFVLLRASAKFRERRQTGSSSN
ncbi:MAG: M50 family metallopeptidase [Planctomycetota bacterium]|nr:M50 family metallopeptidase [Planctomycetota bacterium]